MTRLVIHAGPRNTSWSDVQRQLVAWRQPLHQAGVVLHPDDRPESWLTDAAELARGVQTTALVTTVDAAVSAGASIVLLSAESVGDALRDPDQVANLVAFAKQFAMPLTVVAVVRDQLGRLNEVYCERVALLQMARTFPSFAADPSPPQRYDYSTAFDAVITDPEVDLVAVPYSDLDAGTEAKPVLRAGGVDPASISELPDTPPLLRPPGPVQVAAARLMFKRLWRLGIIKRAPRSSILEAAAALEEHSVTAGWDRAPYWGWDPASRAEAIGRYRPGNDKLARSVWGREWGDDWPDFDFVETDLASLDPRLVVDVLTTIDQLVKDVDIPSETAAES